MALRILIAIMILAIPMELPGCGPYLPAALFYLPRGPESPVDFAAGNLGILQPTYDRIYLVTAYRHLSGVGLNPAEQEAVQPPPPLPDINAPAPTVAPSPWLTARNQTPLIQAVHELDPYRQVQRQGYFDTYLNCNDDAFRTAASTLEGLRRTGNAQEWIAAQDIVFANCSKGATIPAPTADPKMRAGRAYQIASAKFYAEQYDAAYQDFQTIAADPGSQWRTIAPYLAARCLIRAGKLSEANAALQRISADPALARWHAPANSLRKHIAARFHPNTRMHELALALVKPNSQATIGQDLTDYRVLFDRNVMPQPADDLTDWILSLQGGGRDALENWRARRTLPWIVAAMQFAHRDDSALPELLAAAAEVKPDSPAYLTVSYHRTRLAQQPDDARTLADTLLAGKMPTSARNQFRALRMQLARTFEEFLRFAPRRAVATLSYDVELVNGSNEYLDDDAALIFNNSLPLSYLKQAAASQLLPQSVRQQLLRVIFVRTLLLSAAPPFDHVITLLRTPGMKRDMDPGYGRNTTQLDKIDDFRDNWWCSPNVADIHDLAFLSAADRQQVAAEAEKRSIAIGPDWLAAQTIVFAQAHPQDPRVPEALALAVRSTRYGCTDSQTGEFSQRAFNLLHTRYPDSAWTKKTPYWFK